MEGGGLLLADPRGPLKFVAASDEALERLEFFQLQVQEGPCLDAFRTGDAVADVDLREAPDRWPRFAPHAAAAGFRSVHAIPLRLRTQVIGAMGLFGTDVGRLAGTEVEVAQALANVATIGLLQERAIRDGEVLTEQLQAALHSRVVIEQAKGAIAQYLRVSPEEAFLRLRAHARHNSRRLGELAVEAIADPASVIDSDPL